MAISSWIRRQFKNGVTTTAVIPGGLSAVATSFAVGAGTGTSFPDGSVGSFIITVDQSLATEERILCSSRSGDTFTVAASGRGYNNTTASVHSANCTILHTTDQQDFDEANQVAVATLGAIAASGDLLVGSGANALAKLTKGAANTFLVAGASTLGYVAFGSGGTTAIASAGADGTSNNPARYDHTHAQQAGVMNAAVYDVAGVAMQVLGTTATQTTTNKRITKRVVTVAQSATPAINTDNTDVASITGLAQAITSMTSSLTGTPNDGDSLIMRITDNGTARAITWGAKFESSGTVALPGTTVISTMLAVGFIWNTATSAWRCVAVA